MNRMFLFVFAVLPIWAGAMSPQDAERFAHLAGVSLSDLPQLEDLQRKFGTGQVVESGDAGDYRARICYRTAHGANVVEYFHGEVDWGFVVRVAKMDDGRCPTSPALKSSSLSVAGIQLGMKKAEYRQLLGKPQRETPDLLEYHFSYAHILTDTELTKMVEQGRKNGYPPANPEELRRWDVGIDISASFIDGRLASFTVDRVETN